MYSELLPDKHIVDETYFESFIDTALERHGIYIRKEGGQQKPWTDNQIFRDYFFCNVFRQYDKCSKWIIENIVPLERWDALILYRFISAMPTFEIIKDHVKRLDDFNAVRDVLRAMKHEKKTIFSGCFIRNPQLGHGRGSAETHEVPFVIIDDIRRDGRIKDVIAQNSLESMVSYLRKFPATAGFMAYEYACDFEYTKFFNPTDKFTWANMGPGAQQGLGLIKARNRYSKFSKNEWLTNIRLILPVMQEAFSKCFPEETVSMREVEHWLCEFQKYVKYIGMRYDGIKVKHRKYDGGC